MQNPDQSGRGKQAGWVVELPGKGGGGRGVRSVGAVRW